ncbi:hypothetical protein L916_17848 [Phytophthora nicotianae]|uniref:Uncharacterized protein n=1 Tax=Phytophthora nicotianae TaxID=4792 RepID=W2I3P3_PHYNI|nr:hypothetical protein L916_17848 [Phytophthora nicotianae]
MSVMISRVSNQPAASYDELYCLEAQTLIILGEDFMRADVHREMTECNGVQSPAEARI